MTFNEIRAETLKIMFADLDYDVSIRQYDSNGNLQGLSLLENDENIGPYLKGMAASINRCYSIIEARGVLPNKRAELTDEGESFFVSSLPEDYYSLERTEEMGTEYRQNIPYQLSGDKIIIPGAEEGSKYFIVYKPKIKRLTEFPEDTEVLDCPDSISCYIPYFIKGELYREDEPAEAEKARNTFDTAMLELIPKEHFFEQERVKSIYGGLML